MTRVLNKDLELINKYFDKEANIHEIIAIEALKIKSNFFKKKLENEINFMDLIRNSFKRAKKLAK